MDIYSVLVVDDHYEERKSMYTAFFEETFFEETEYAFRVIPIQSVGEFNEFCRETTHVDAIFLDAVLRGSWTGHYNYLGVLQQLEKKYAKRHTPPIFMVSQHWRVRSKGLESESDERGLSLFDVSLAISSTLSRFSPPSAYYDFEKIISVVNEARKYSGYADRSSAASKIKSLSLHRSFVKDEIAKHQAMEKADAIIVSAVADEKRMTYKVFGLTDENDKALNNHGLVYQRTTIGDKSIVFVTQNGMGLAVAARVAECAINIFEPKVIIMAGVCAAEKGKLRLGSVVVPREVFDYSSGKITTDKQGKTVFRQRSKSVTSNANTEAFFQYIENEENARTTLATIRNQFQGAEPEKQYAKQIVTYPMASGPVIVDSKEAYGYLKQIVPTDKFCSIDMEAFALASVANTHGIPWLVVKTVQDYANGRKGATELVAREFASFTSAMFLKLHLLRIIG